MEIPIEYANIIKPAINLTDLIYNLESDGVITSFKACQWNVIEDRKEKVNTVFEFVQEDRKAVGILLNILRLSYPNIAAMIPALNNFERFKVSLLKNLFLSVIVKDGELSIHFQSLQVITRINDKKGKIFLR